MAERAQQPAAAVHGQVARGPQGGRADVAGEDGVVRRRAVDQARQVLRVDRLASRLARRELVERLARLAVVSERACRGAAVDLRFPWRAGAAPPASSGRRPPVPGRSRRAAPQVLGAHVDLRDRRLGRIELRDRGSRCRASAAASQSMHRVVARTRSRAGRSCRRRTGCRTRRAPCRASRERSAPPAPSAIASSSSWAPAQPAPARIVDLLPPSSSSRRPARAIRVRGAEDRAGMRWAAPAGVVRRLAQGDVAGDADDRYAAATERRAHGDLAAAAASVRAGSIDSQKWLQSLNSSVGPRLLEVAGADLARWGSGRRWPAPERGCDGSRRGR